MKKHDLIAVAALVNKRGARKAAEEMGISRARVYQLMEKHKRLVSEQELSKSNAIYRLPARIRMAIRKNYGDVSTDQLLAIMQTTNMLIVPLFGPKLVDQLNEWAKSQRSESA